MNNIKSNNDSLKRGIHSIPGHSRHSHDSYLRGNQKQGWIDLTVGHSCFNDTLDKEGHVIAMLPSVC